MATAQRTGWRFLENCRVEVTSARTPTGFRFQARGAQATPSKSEDKFTPSMAIMEERMLSEGAKLLLASIDAVVISRLPATTLPSTVARESWLLP